MKVQKGSTIKAISKYDNTTITGKVTDVDGDVITVKTPEGGEMVINVLQFVVTIIPLLDQIINWFRGLFRKRK